MGFFSRKQASGDNGLPPLGDVGAPLDLNAGSAIEVRANEGPMPATRERLAAIKASGDTRVDVVLTDTALVSDEELLELIELEVRDLADQLGLTVATISRRP